VAPVWALKRERARLTMDMVRRFTNSGYSHSGASRTKKSMQGWISTSRSPQEDVGYNLPLLRERSRDLFMSGGIGTSAIKKNQSNILGAGLELKCRLNYERLDLTEQQAKDWEDRTEFEFKLWAESKIDHTGLNDFYDAQRIMLTGWLLNGDSLALIKFADRPDGKNPYRLRLHLIEADRLSTPQQGVVFSQFPAFDFAAPDYVALPNGGAIMSGVEVDTSGQVVAFWIANQYPNSLLPTGKPLEWQRVPARNTAVDIPNVIFVADPDRAEQYRGVPYLAPVIEQIKQMTRYTEAEITAAIINSFFTAFIKVNGPTNEPPFGDSIPEEQQAPIPLSERIHSYELGPGTINALDVGEDVVFSDPKRPHSGFEAFMRAMAQLAGASLDIPYEVLLSVFNSSYSASRAALLQAWRAFRDRRKWFAKDFCQQVYETWLFEAVATGRIQAPGFFTDPARRKLWCSADWVGPAPPQIDPTKEVEAAAKRVKEGFSTRERETAELTGMNYDDNVRILRRENEQLKQALGEGGEI